MSEVSDALHIIHLPERIDRMKNILTQSIEQCFWYRIWNGIMSDGPPRTNISRAFKQIVAWAKKTKQPYVRIAEDDIVFTAPGAWQQYLQSMPLEFDQYLGGVYSATLNDWPVDGRMMHRIMNGYSGNTLVTVHERMYDFFLTADETKDLDRWLGEYAFEKLYLVCAPFVVKQMGGYSDNKKRFLTYELMESEFKYFGQK